MRFIAYETVPTEGFDVVTAPHRRTWMSATHDRSAYRCLPMLLANQAGWMILNPATVRVKWNGGALLDAVDIQRWQPANTMQVLPDYVWPTSHFGSGIITWNLPYLFRTPPGYNLLVRGPANQIKDGVAPLEGLVETDWATATFTMNWKMTREDTWITFDKGEPLCMIVPQRRFELEEFVPAIRPLTDNLELQTAYKLWCDSRDNFNDVRRHESEDWEKDYFRGQTVSGETAHEHQTKLRLQEFTRASID